MNPHSEDTKKTKDRKSINHVLLDNKQHKLRIPIIILRHLFVVCSWMSRVCVVCVGAVVLSVLVLSYVSNV